MNRKQRRKLFDKVKKKMHLTSWKEWNDIQDKEQPYINHDKKK